MDVRAHVWIEGEVQGVSFRAYTAREAARYGLSGWVHNLEDGRVEAVFEGHKGAVDALIAWCERGSPRACVERVSVLWEAVAGETDFVIRR